MPLTISQDIRQQSDIPRVKDELKKAFLGNIEHQAQQATPAINFISKSQRNRGIRRFLREFL